MTPFTLKSIEGALVEEKSGMIINPNFRDGYNQAISAQSQVRLGLDVEEIKKVITEYSIKNGGTDSYIWTYSLNELAQAIASQPLRVVKVVK